jgi:signal transduction histidine kinase
MSTTSGVAAAADWWQLPSEDASRLVAAANELSQLRNLEGVIAAVRRHARELMGAEGVTFVLCEGEQVFYADEDAIGPLWKGLRFPASACISGWAITHKQTVAIRDVYADPRVPIEAYRPTFVKSLLMVPIGAEEPVGAIGAYWAAQHLASERERLLLETLAGFVATAVANAQLLEEAQEAVRTRDQWIGIASHELRTPLTPMKIHMQAMRMALARGVPPQELASHVDRAEKNVDRLSRLVDELLDYSRITSDQVQLAIERFDLIPLVREICEHFQQDVAGGAAGPVDLSAPASLVGRWDRRRVEAVVLSLVSNALKYGAGAPVRLEVAAEGGGARLLVADQGTGIRPGDQERIFQPFTRLKDAHQGLGLGLWLARRIVQAHAGCIEVTSRPGSGTTVVVTLPSAG